MEEEILSQLNSYIHSNDDSERIIFHVPKELYMAIIPAIQGKLTIEVVLLLERGEIYQGYIDNLDMFIKVCKTHNIVLRKLPV